MIIYAIVVFLFFSIILRKSIKIVQSTEEQIVERFGKYYKTLFAGIHLINPIIDKVVGVVNLSRQNLDMQILTITKDDIRIDISCRVFYLIIDSQKCFYNISNLAAGIESVMAMALRDYAAVMNLEELTFSKDKMSYRLTEILQQAISEWGCKVQKVEVLDFVQPSSTKNTMDNFYKEEEDVWVG